MLPGMEFTPTSISTSVIGKAMQSLDPRFQVMEKTLGLLSSTNTPHHILLPLGNARLQCPRGHLHGTYGKFAPACRAAVSTVIVRSQSLKTTRHCPQMSTRALHRQSRRDQR